MWRAASKGLVILSDSGKTAVAVLVRLCMVKTTREDENQRRSRRLTSSTSTRLRKEQVVFAPQICSSGQMKGEFSEAVHPTGRPNSKFMVPSRQPALNLVASAATEDSGRQLPSPAIAIERQQVTCMKSAYGTAYEPHFAEPAPAQATDERRRFSRIGS